MAEWLKDAKLVWLVLGVVAQAAITHWQTWQHSETLQDHESRLRDLETNSATSKAVAQGQEKRLDHHQALLDGPR